MSTLLPRLRLAFQADESNRHIRKDSLVAEVLEQRLLLSGLWDDHGDNAATATSIAKNSWVAGNIETKFDTDYFKFYAYSGYQYTLETSAGTLIDTYLLLYDKDGATLIGSDDDSGTGYASKVSWVAPTSGYYYAAVQSSWYMGESASLNRRPPFFDAAPNGSKNLPGERICYMIAIEGVAPEDTDRQLDNMARR